jgi:hypothetical protein
MAKTHNAAEVQGITISGIRDAVLVCQNCGEACASCDADLLDENDKVVITITEREMTHTWNLVEGGAQ